MTTMITTLGKDYSVKALATDVGGKLFVRATIAMETSNLVTIDEEVVSSFADARDNALAAAIQIVNRMAESASSVTDGVRTDEKNETSAAPTKRKGKRASASEPMTNMDMAAPALPSDTAVQDSANSEAVAESAALPEKEVTTEALPQNDAPEAAEDVAESKPAANDEAEAESTASDAVEKDISDNSENEESKMTLEKALSTKLKFNENETGASSSLKKYADQELSVLWKQKPSMVRLLVNRPNILTKECAEAVKLIARS
jgi:hypothetical protein